MLKKRLNRIFSIFLVNVFCFSSLLHAEELPRSMAAIGDSISAGAFAHLNRTDGWSPLLLPKIFMMIAKFGVKRSIEAVERRDYSWTTGLNRKMKVLSHAHRLRYLTHLEGMKFDVYNGAVSREASEHLAEQVEQVLKWSEKTLGQATPDYMTLLVGPNDVCLDKNEEMTSEDDFHMRVEDVVDRLLKRNSNIKIMISTLPNVAYLREAARESRVGPLMNCQKVWRAHRFCPNLLEEEDERLRAEVSERIEAYNEAILDIRDQYNASYGQDNIAVAEETYQYQFFDTDLSIDCFHPNVQGQNALAEITWNSTWWGGGEWRNSREDFYDYMRATQRKIRLEELRKRRRGR